MLVRISAFPAQFAADRNRPRECRLRQASDSLLLRHIFRRTQTLRLTEVPSWGCVLSLLSHARIRYNLLVSCSIPANLE